MFSHKVSRFQFLRQGLAFMVFGVVVTAAIYIVDSFHPIGSTHRAGLLGGAEGFILIGIVMFLIGWKRRDKPDNSLHS